MKRNGFTLVELMVVIAILAILAGIAVPMYTGYVSSAKKTEAQSNLETLRLLEEQHFADNRTYIVGEYKVGDTSLQTALPGFQPGLPEKLNYEYKVEANPATSNDIATSFLVTAIPRAGKAPAGDFTIDERNVKSW